MNDDDRYVWAVAGAFLIFVAVVMLIMWGPG